MNKILILPFLAGIVLLSGCAQPVKNDVATQTPPAAEQVKLASTNYIPYSSKAVSDASNNGKDVAIFFHSKSCGSCAKLEKDILANASSIPDDVVILKADRDTSADLADEFDVAGYHTVSYLWQERNVKGLFTLADLISEFDNVDEVVEVSVSNWYLAFNEAEFEKAKDNGKDIAIFFHSKSCGSCAKLDEDIVANTRNISDDTIIFKADWDTSADLAAKYGVDKYHTVTVFDGDEATNIKGLFTLEELLTNAG